MPEVEVSLARAGERAALANLMQLYIHDFSEFWAGTGEGELQDDGRFADYPLDAYWREPSRIPLLFRIDGALVGFALLNAVGHGLGAIHRNMAEFFIVRKYRRGGVGTAAARQVFSLYPGRWEVAVAQRNQAALPFWRQAIIGCDRVADVSELDVDNGAWNGPLFRFRWV
ncbi:MAG TPA: GNAT family N-acetyltransferase [Caulobacteraceae bacterium]|jgi:predicted acetyltransferase